MIEPSAAGSPLPPAERIAEIDALRGFAVLGILVMNVQSFSMPAMAYMNPALFGDLSGVDRVLWLLSHLLADKKFMTIFALLFGAGIVLLTERIERRGGSARGVHYRRTFWLIVIGLVHAYGLWHGDILVTYGICALVAYPFRRVRPGRLLAAGLSIFAVASIFYLFVGLSMPWWEPAKIEGLMETWRPPAGRIAGEIAAYRGGWLDQMPHRAGLSFFMETFLLVVQTGWRTLGLMLTGMALFKWGILSGRRSARFYRWMVALGLLVGLPVVGWGAMRNFAAGWSLEYSMFIGVQYNYWFSLLVSGGWIGAVMLACRANAMKRPTRTLAAVGRMALTNYLLQTVICTTLFYGHGFKLFGRLGRAWHPLVILFVWIVELAWSPWWLARFRFGPVEWLWRSLTYRARQPMRR
ncbi:MAG: DUF418 domain-containing protein [Candidatus Krumholzibacteriota bacterium]|nr:DUF418 domain-containing protein [Candidatus Krumholzibacteriota bacterium]